jgi:translation initiation factor 4E
MAVGKENVDESHGDQKIAGEKDAESAVALAVSETQGIKHPLQSKWQLWYFRPDKSRSWEDNLLKVTQFDTVEDFWALYNHIELASNLAVGSDYNIFKVGIKPMWEDDRNRKGGRWLFVVNKKQGRNVDELWLDALLCLIGEAFGEDSDQICGAVINIRAKMDKIAIWTSESKNKESILNIGRTLKARTHFDMQISYETHADTQVKTSSSAKHVFTV